MSNSNFELQATHHIISTLIASREALDSVFVYTFDGIIISDENFNIVFSNNNSAKIFNLSTEQVFRQNLKVLFNEQFSAIEKNVSDHLSTDLKKFPEVQITLFTQNQYREYLVSTLRIQNRYKHSIYVFLLRDITELIKNKKRTHDVLLSLDTGIMYIDTDGKIENYNPNLIANLLPDIQFNKFHDLVGFINSNLVDHTEIAAWENIADFQNTNPDELKSLISFLKTNLEVKIRDHKVNIKLTLKPVIEKNTVQGMIVYLDSPQKKKNKDSSNLDQNDLKVNRFIELSSTEKDVLEVIFEDLRHHFAKIREYYFSKKWAQLKEILHAIKGLSRTIGLTALPQIAHQFELAVVMRDLGLSEDIDISPHYDRLLTEWREVGFLSQKIISPESEETTKSKATLTTDALSAVYSYLQHSTDSSKEKIEILERIYDLLLSDFSDIEQWVKILLSQFDSQQKIQVNFLFDFSIYFSEQVKKDICNILQFLITNSISHFGKTTDVQIRLSGFSAEKDNSLVIICEDNGNGVDRETLIEKLNSFGDKVAYNIDTIELLKMTSNRNISSKATADQISGHGIGMSAIFSLIYSYNGRIDYAESDLGGAAFKITLPNAVTHQPEKN